MLARDKAIAAIVVGMGDSAGAHRVGSIGDLRVAPVAPSAHCYPLLNSARR